MVFTSYPKNKEQDEREQKRYNNLLRLCKQNSKQLSPFNLKIVGLKEGKLHDRYILVLNSSCIPVEGFHLSNSLQAATVNQPLLITPIPQDVLLEVTDYMHNLVQQSNNSQNKELGIKIIFDTKQSIEESQAQFVEVNGLNDESPLSNLNDDQLIDPSQKSRQTLPLKRMLISQEKLTCPNALVQNLNNKLLAMP